MSSTVADLQVTARVTSRMNFSRPSSRGPPSRPSSPSKVRATAQATSASTPPIRPKAKVSSSAQVGNSRKPPIRTNTGNTSSARHGTAGASFRSPSPLKLLETRSGRASPAHLSNVRARTDSRTLVTASVPPSPRISRPPSVVHAVPSESNLNSGSSSRPRVASISSTSQLSTSSSVVNQRANGLLAPVSTQETTSSDGDTGSNVNAPIRVTSKVSGIVKRKPSIASSPLQTSSFSATSGPLATPSRPPSPVVTRLTATPPSPADPQFYPITTASPIANVHRFATTRRASSSFSRSPLPYTIVKSGESFANGRVDPASIPLPPLSPPGSAVSYSSQSSVSRSSRPESNASGDTLPSFNPHFFNGHVRTFSHDSAVRDGLGLVGRIRSASELRMPIGDIGGNTRAASGIVNGATEDERKVKAEAKSNRKIADLEITNQSLLAINASLEETKHRQAREIRDLKRKLRESRLILPPRTFKQLQSGENSSDFDEDEDDDDDSDRQATSPIAQQDETFDRVRIILENLLESGRRALESTIAEHASFHVGTKVLHETEARTWRDKGFKDDDEAGDISVNIDEGSTTFDTEEEEDSGDCDSGEIFIVAHNGDSSLRSEDEVEEMMEMIHVTDDPEG